MPRQGVVTLGPFRPYVWLADASAAIYDIENLASASQTQPSARPKRAQCDDTLVTLYAFGLRFDVLCSILDTKTFGMK